MNLDKNQLKSLITYTKPQDLHVLTVNRLEKNSVKLCLNEIEKLIKKDQDYVVTVIKR